MKTFKEFITESINHYHINDDSKAIELYHGTNHDFDEFKTKNTGRIATMFGNDSVERHGSFHTDDKNIAKDFGKNIIHSRVQLKNPFDMSKGVSEKMESDYDKHGGSTKFLYNSQPDWEKFDGSDGKHHTDVIKKAGYDSVIFNDEHPHTGKSFKSYVLLHPHKVSK